jgi:hypothetical protein
MLRKVIKTEINPGPKGNTQKLYLFVHGYWAQPGLDEVSNAVFENRHWGRTETKIETVEDGFVVVLEGPEKAVTQILHTLREKGWDWADHDERIRFEMFKRITPLDLEK